MTPKQRKKVQFLKMLCDPAYTPEEAHVRLRRLSAEIHRSKAPVIVGGASTRPESPHVHREPPSQPVRPGTHPMYARGRAQAAAF